MAQKDKQTDKQKDRQTLRLKKTELVENRKLVN